MVTLITEKLQNQSLDDLTRRACEAVPYSAEKLDKSGHLFPLEIGVDKSPWKASHGGWPFRSRAASGPFSVGPHGVSHTEGLKWQLESPGPMAVGRFLDLRESTGPPAAPPTKRHCRSLSEPEELARCRSPWRPGSSKVWTPISKRRCNSGGSATLQCCSGLGNPALQGSLAPGLPRKPVSPTGPTSPMTPRPASASSGFVDGSEGSTSSGPPWLSTGPCPFSSRRRLSLSQEHLVDAGACLPSASSTPTSTPELGRHHGLLRCRSQPCVLDGRRVRRKRRREEDARWTRPSLDFLKMTRTLKNSKSLCSLDYEDDEDDTQAKTVVSSPCNSQGLVGIITPSSSPRIPRPGPASPSVWASGEPETSTGEGGSSGEPSDWDSAGEEGIFPLDHGDLDLEQIENN
ncbi:similar to RIKEN cDNA 2410018C17 (predicted), isoform CRA_a [Rattus norvegicus]|uniref:Protein FAM53A n=2 Tax=Rattus norvegicus TaxID=10116 RepID=A6IK61_RAT|nr:protein FAM53A [Rattus norvegicus]XP_006251324.1 protein FAM53A isoform X1 [Rattus norvegicus]XP_006251328.1 protein FAM53A isoform X1 [Rattus norvegicus]XP_006251329.1 protein FAM53A isoform X1 [Rattus norvegicus]XP_006251330.1 protein FAM53A isoform X1 [Rattus norvegicus]XP_006251332.1 protein FAM53A isoform X1 [Rattus norvegicus]XP_038947910.1 protein FAM53A isoform X1 [Rattus norvegicus]XP_038947911.1 protein FAM53A isoform X1 [Rattus norvegicus]AAI68895.1 Fam53a protein [Rattus norv|eukprot:NP_001100698.1 protein FAM53A [Rattus norvegicus]